MPCTACTWDAYRATSVFFSSIRRHTRSYGDWSSDVCSSDLHTGRSPKDRFIVAEPGVKEQVDWGAVNLPMEPAVFARLAGKVRAYLQNRELFVFDGWACADPAHRLAVRVVTEKAWHSLFSRCLLISPPAHD